MSTLIALAERVEDDSRTSLPIGPTLVELAGVLVECEAQATLPTPEGSDPFARMRRVVDQLRRDVTGGRVQSISGLAAEARRLANKLDPFPPVEV